MSNLIDRQAAIDAIYETFCYAYCDNCEKEMNEDLCGDCHRKYQNWAASKKIISKTINSLPSAQPEVLAHGEGELSAQPEPQWIPGNERIPEGLIIVQFNDGDFDLLQFPTGYRRKDIVAWMPLPESYKGEQP